ncbi:coatomer subunit epsilon isoform X2 [Pantherophis guttatus]|uniref:Coatomer subunit epsilon isoform X2 n=1 Tax=Pantherophis guttatus TaxID=94885 RepID=A0ABM3ZR14_PANGU|nr:coatomer subunit epsilon isoform X2 [Pantherophis guttatus]
MAESLFEPTPVQSVPWQALQASLKAHYAPVTSKFVQRYEFRQRLQREGEPISTYMAALRKAAKHCEYQDLDEVLLEQLICGIGDIRLQRRLLARSNLTLPIALDEARAHESSTKAVETLQRLAPSQTMHKSAPVHSEVTQTDSEEELDENVFQTERHRRERRERREDCASCGGSHQQQTCKFRDSICRHCDKKGHLARVCRASLPSSHKPKSGPSQSKPAGHKRANKYGDPKKARISKVINSSAKGLSGEN